MLLRKQDVVWKLLNIGENKVLGSFGSTFWLVFEAVWRRDFKLNLLKLCRNYEVF
jgi:hypothetical protein